MTPETFGTTVVRCSRPEIEWIDITALGADRPTYIEKWRGWIVELWSDWEWVGP